MIAAYLLISEPSDNQSYGKKKKRLKTLGDIHVNWRKQFYLLFTPCNNHWIWLDYYSKTGLLRLLWQSQRASAQASICRWWRCFQGVRDVIREILMAGLILPDVLLVFFQENLRMIVYFGTSNIWNVTCRACRVVETQHVVDAEDWILLQCEQLGEGCALAEECRSAEIIISDCFSFCLGVPIGYWILSINCSWCDACFLWLMNHTFLWNVVYY